VRKLLEKLLEIPDDELPKQVDVVIGIGVGLSHVFHGSCHDFWTEIILSPQSKKVVSLVVKLFKEGRDKRVFFSGGYSYRSHYESFVMRREFLNVTNRETKRLYPAFEIESRDSLGNAVETLKWMEENSCKSAIVVDFAGHLKQMRRIFLKQARNKGIKLYFINAYSEYGGNTRTRLNNFYLFFVWEILTNIYYKLKDTL